jgi:hypothetical protein
MGRIDPRFARSVPRERVRDYIAELVSGVQRKNSWWIAEHTGETGKARFDVEAIRDDLAAYVAERLGKDDGVLILDETGFVKKGRASRGSTQGRRGESRTPSRSISADGLAPAGTSSRNSPRPAATATKSVSTRCQLSGCAIHKTDISDFDPRPAVGTGCLWRGTEA